MFCLMGGVFQKCVVIMAVRRVQREVTRYASLSISGKENRGWVSKIFFEAKPSNRLAARLC